MVSRNESTPPLRGPEAARALPGISGPVIHGLARGAGPRIPGPARGFLATLLAVTLASAACLPLDTPPPSPRRDLGAIVHADPIPDGFSVRAQRLLAKGPPRGIALGLFSQDPGYDYFELLREIRDTGAPWVSLVCNYYQVANDAVEIGIPDPRTPNRERLRITIREARGIGLRVMLFPVLLIRDPEENEWRGTLAPSDRNSWYADYRELLLSLAQLAQDEGVELFSIGSEFNSLQEDTADWLDLIQSVRNVFTGALTYSVNWDTVERPAFFASLDFVGMTTYFSLSDTDDPTVDQLVKTWETIREDVLLWQANHGYPLIFTEVGFASQNGNNQNPWNYYLSTQVDLEEQRDCYEAFTRVWLTEPALSGLFFYNWFGQGGAEDKSYTPRGKPAVEVLRRWFRAPAVSQHGRGPSAGRDP